MNASSKITALVFASLLLGGYNQARAQIHSPVDLINGNSLSFDGLSFTISGCTLKLNGGAADTCTSAGLGDTNDVLEITSSRRGQPTIEVLGNGTGIAGGVGSVAKGSNALACSNCGSASEQRFHCHRLQQRDYRRHVDQARQRDIECALCRGWRRKRECHAGQPHCLGNGPQRFADQHGILG